MFSANWNYLKEDDLKETITKIKKIIVEWAVPAKVVIISVYLM